MRICRVFKVFLAAEARRTIDHGFVVLRETNNGHPSGGPVRLHPGRPEHRQFPVLPGLVIANPLKVDVTCAPIRGFPATFLYGRPFCVLERDSGAIFTLTSVTDPGSFIIHCSPLHWIH